MGVDIIGDLHGDAAKLRALLKKMGYHESSRSWFHNDRRAIFLGDFIDRGPAQLEACDIVRRMIDRGSAQAVMGNHEFNAIAWFLEDPSAPGEYLRRHTEKNRQQHEAFLAEVENTPMHKEMIEWFITLPLWLELDGLRVVHACWNAAYMAEIGPHLQPGCLLNESLMVEASRPETMAFRTIEGLLKGIEWKLPSGFSFLDKGGHARDQVRVRWWDSEATTYRALALLDEAQCAGLPDSPIPADIAVGYRDSSPVFIGHYSLSGRPAVLAPKVACVDYYSKTDNPLVAYRWDGEDTLDNANFVSV